MQLFTLATAAILCCWIPTVMGSDLQYMDVGSLNSVETVTHKGSKLRVYTINGVRVAEPRISFGNTCENIEYSYLYRRYQLTFPISIDVNALKSSRRGAKVGQLTVTELRLKINKALDRKESGYRFLAAITSPGRAQLIVLCHSYIQCTQMRDYISAKPGVLSSAIKFVPVGSVSGTPVMFGATISANSPPRINCNRGRWVVFQKRVDGSLSFAQNWDAYVKGFGDPNSNYWMGLDRLFAKTATSSYDSRCRLRIETQDFRGKKYWGEYGMFEVLGPRDGYTLRLGRKASGSTIDMMHHNGARFSTYDRDQDKSSSSCSKTYGYGGWWYNNCHAVNLNGAYTTDKSITSHAVYDCVHYRGKYIPMKRTLMKFMCH